VALEWAVWVDLVPWVAQGWAVEWGDMVVEWEEMVVEWGIMGVMNGMAAVRLKMCMVVGTLRWTGCMCLLEKDGIYPVFVTAPVFMRK